MSTLRKVRLIQDKVCEMYGISIDDLVGTKRHAELIVPRHIAMELCRKLTLAQWEVIGRAFHRDHASIMRAATSVVDRAATDKRFATDYNLVSRVVEGALAET